MILVFFRGYGEWFIRDGKNLRLAIPRTTKEPYTERKRIETYDEWLGLDEDNTETLLDNTYIVSVQPNHLN